MRSLSEASGPATAAGPATASFPATEGTGGAAWCRSVGVVSHWRHWRCSHGDLDIPWCRSVGVGCLEDVSEETLTNVEPVREGLHTMSLSEVDYAHAWVFAVTASKELQCVAGATEIATPVAGHSRDVERAATGKMNGTVRNGNINLPIFGSVCHPMNNT